MQNLNLIDASLSDISYDIIEFSDGESHIKFNTEINRKDTVQVLTRISSIKDLFILMQVGDILNRAEVEWALVITYLMGMRMDRVMSFNEAYTLKIVSKIINDLHAVFVYVVEPHSDKTITLINNCKPINNSFIEILNTQFPDNYILVFPDAGAKLRYSEAEINWPIITCSKKRDINTGALSGFTIENPEIISNLPNINGGYTFIVLDDLCDGGGTFCGIADLLSKIAPSYKKVLAITHAVNLKGIMKVGTYYDEVFITDSYKNWQNEEYIQTHDNIKVVKVNPTFFTM